MKSPATTGERQGLNRKSLAAISITVLAHRPQFIAETDMVAIFSGGPVHVDFACDQTRRGVLAPLRRMAARQRLRLRKCPVRDPHAGGFGMFMLAKEEDGVVVYRRDKIGGAWAGTLDGAEAYLKGEG